MVDSRPTIRLERGEPVKVDGQWEISLIVTVRFGERLLDHPLRVVFHCVETNEQYQEMTDQATGRAAKAFYLDTPGVYTFVADAISDDGTAAVTSNREKVRIVPEAAPSKPKPAKGQAFLSGQPGGWRVNIIVRNDDGTPAKDVPVVIMSETGCIKLKTDDDGVVSNPFTITEPGASMKVEVVVPAVDLKDDFVLRGPRRLPPAAPEGTGAIGRFVHNFRHSNNTRAMVFLAVALAWFAVNLFVVGLDARPTETMPVELQRVQNLAVHGQYKTSAELTGANSWSAALWNWMGSWSWKFNFFFFIFALVYAVAAMREEIGYAHQLAYNAYKNRLASAEIKLRREAAPATTSRESATPTAIPAVLGVGAKETASAWLQYATILLREFFMAFMADKLSGR